MKTFKFLLGLAIASTILVSCTKETDLLAPDGMQKAPATSQTAQSIMVDIKGGGVFIIVNEQTWNWDKDAAEAFFTVEVVSGNPGDNEVVLTF